MIFSDQLPLGVHSSVCPSICKQFHICSASSRNTVVISTKLLTKCLSNKGIWVGSNVWAKPFPRENYNLHVLESKIFSKLYTECIWLKTIQVCQMKGQAILHLEVVMKWSKELHVLLWFNQNWFLTNNALIKQIQIILNKGLKSS